jgi:hypothetical protein
MHDQEDQLLRSRLRDWFNTPGGLVVVSGVGREPQRPQLVSRCGGIMPLQDCDRMQVEDGPYQVGVVGIGKGSAKSTEGNALTCQIATVGVY